MAVETTVISMAAMKKARSSATTVRGRLVGRTGRQRGPALPAGQAGAAGCSRRRRGGEAEGGAIRGGPAMAPPRLFGLGLGLPLHSERPQDDLHGAEAGEAALEQHEAHEGR